MTKITREMVKQAMHDVAAGEFTKIADSLNAQLEPDQPNFVVNWEKQSYRAPVIGEDGSKLCLDELLIDADWTRVKPDYSRWGKWIVDEPLRGKPEGLSDDATVIVKRKGFMWSSPTSVTNLSPSWWSEAESFMVVEPGVE